MGETGVAAETRIHPTAIVDPSAELGAGVTVGPYSIIGREARIGEGTIIRERASVCDFTILGAHNEIFPGAVVGGEPQDLKFRGARTVARIGDHNTIRECVTVNRATDEGEETVVGSHNLLMAYSHVAHNCVIEDRVIMGNSAALAGHIHVGSWAIISGMAGIHQFVNVGEHCFISALSAVRKDVVPYTLVSGDPCKPHGINTVGLRRRGFSQEAISRVKYAYRVIFREQLTLDEALQQLRSEHPDSREIEIIVKFIEDSERGITR